jgi:periplasmic mercuric ion binding protein
MSCEEGSMITRILQIGGLVVGISLLAVGLGVHTRVLLVSAADAPDLQTFTLQIDGMTCGSCVKDIRSALLQVPGVKAVDFQIKKKWFFFHEYSDARVVIGCEPGKTTVSALVAAIEGASSPTSTYKSKPVS